MKGLFDFRDFFRAYHDSYVLIGGAACDVWLSAANVKARVTKDFDLVLLIESLDPGFTAAFWRYVEERGYSYAALNKEDRRYYRFESPQVSSAPEMIELFARRPDMLPLDETRRLRRIRGSGDVASLSAILLDDDYYNLVVSLRREREGLSLLAPLGLIPLKARAYLDLARRKAKGESIDAVKIRKHRSDIFRLLLIVNPAERVSLASTVQSDLEAFMEASDLEPGFDWKVFAKSLGVPESNLEERVFSALRSAYSLKG